MPRIADAASPQARELADYIDTHYGNRSGILSAKEANRAIRSLASDPTLKAKFEELFSSAPPARAAELIRALFTQTSPPPPADPTSVGARGGGPGAIFLQQDGTFSIGPTPAGSGPLASAPALYEAALLAREGINPFAAASIGTKARAVQALEASGRLGAERAEREVTASEATMQLKSGSATLLLELAAAASSPEEKQIREKAVALHLELAEREIHRGLSVSRALNLDAVKGELGLTAAQLSRLDGLMKKALPDRPPYEEWFKNGNTTLNEKHYIHEEFYEELVSPYLRPGFTRTTLAPGHEVFEGTVKDPTGQHPDTHFRVEVFKVEDYGTDRQMLRHMNDPNVQADDYTGHSNLGGNIAMALRAAPSVELGTKLVHMGMCRGQQNVPEFTNSFPRAHLITTLEPAYGYEINAATDAKMEMIAQRQGYAFFKQRPGVPDHYLTPNDPRLYGLYDLDKDGQTDGGFRVDKLFDIYPRAPRGREIDFRPGPSADPARIDGTSAVNALGFANTLLTYHVEHGDGHSPITAQYTDRLVADGFYHSEAEELLRITPEQVNGVARYRVAINSRYANQSEDALGMMVLYELNRYITGKARPLSLDDKLRGMLFAAEWIGYMVGAGDEADQLVQNLGRVYGWPASVTHSRLADALEVDSHGYVSTASVNALKQSLGGELGDGSNIR